MKSKDGQCLIDPITRSAGGLRFSAAINRFRVMRALDERLHQAGLAHCFDWGEAVQRAFMRGAGEARPLPQPDRIEANSSLKPTVRRAA